MVRVRDTPVPLMDESSLACHGARCLGGYALHVHAGVRVRVGLGLGLGLETGLGVVRVECG